MDTLYDIVLKKKQEVSGITSNPTLNTFDLEYCKRLDANASSDAFIADRIKKVVKELELAGGIDYNDHFRLAYDAYNEAVCYYDLQERGFAVQNILEEGDPTPDFKIAFTFKNWEGEDKGGYVFEEVKSLSFADGNLQYKKVQQAALESQIKIENQHRRGCRVCSSEYEVAPLGDKDKGLTSEIEIITRKIEQNIKTGQYTYGNGQDTVLLVDLSQYIFPFGKEDCLPVYPDLNKKCSSTGRLWMVAFGRPGERIFNWCEFEGQGNLDTPLQTDGILNSHPYIKGIIFRSGAKYGKIRYYGLFRKADEDLETPVVFMRQLCEFVNDDANSWGFQFFEELKQ